MCGICGFVGSFDGSQLRPMTDALHHRGPDDWGEFHGEGVGLGHRRLSIIDVAGGKQPITNADESVAITYNGEVYNYEELRARFLQGYDFATRSDTEVILHLYEEFGEKCVEYLDGMFAFAIWDGKKKRLVLARDRFGIKPLYYAHTPRGLAFASEVKALLAGGVLEPSVDPEALDLYLGFRYVPGEQTMFQGVKKLNPGEVAVFQDGSLRTSTYWRMSYERRHLGESEAVETFSTLLRTAIEERLMSEVPLGAFLSGGLDSSLVVALMSEGRSSPVSTFTAQLQGKWYDESGYARIVADRFATDHHPLTVEGDAASILRRVVWHMDEPMADPAAVPTYLLSQLTKEHVTVVLTGEGADELLGGYDKYRALLYGARARRLGAGRLGPLVHRMSSGIQGRRLAEYLREDRPVEAYEALTSVFNAGEKESLFGPRLAGMAPGELYRSAIREAIAAPEAPRDYLHLLMHLDIRTWLPNDVLLKVDKMSMAHGLEARVPFLDHQLAGFLASLPPNFKVRWFREKRLMRKAMKPLVPKTIVRRRKHGFTVPVQAWMRSSLKPLVDAAFDEKRLRSLGYFDPVTARGLLGKDLSNSFYRRQLWALLVFDIWHRIFIEGESVDG